MAGHGIIIGRGPGHHQHEAVPGMLQAPACHRGLKVLGRLRSVGGGLWRVAAITGNSLGRSSGMKIHRIGYSRIGIPE